MDKKKQFQIDTLKSKIVTYNKHLDKLLEQKHNLEQQLSQLNPDRSHIDELIKEKQLLEAQLQQLKKQIGTITNTISITTDSLKQQPMIRDEKKQNEINILDAELERIKLKRLEEADNYTSILDQASSDKEALQLEIRDMEIAIEQQNEVIKELQIEAHSSRKSTLEQLHQKKADRKEIEKQKLAVQEFIDNSIADIGLLEAQKIRLDDFKNLLVNSIYSSFDPEKESLITNLHLEYNIEKYLRINEKLKIIDRKKEDIDRRIKVITKNSEKNKRNFEQRLQTIIDTYNQANHRHGNGRVSYKDQFKAEKEKRNYYCEILYSLQDKYNNWDYEVVGLIKKNYDYIVRELEYDNCRALERLDIMKQRIETEYVNECIRLKLTLNSLTKEKKNTRNEFDNTNIKIKEIQQLIENENSLGFNINILDIEIDKYRSMIIQTESSINALVG